MTQALPGCRGAQTRDITVAQSFTVVQGPTHILACVFFMCVWLRWLFVTAYGLCLVAVRGLLLLQCAGSDALQHVGS